MDKDFGCAACARSAIALAVKVSDAARKAMVKALIGRCFPINHESLS